MRDKTEVTPGIYTSKSVCFAYDWSSVAKAYPLWVAQYPNYEETGFLAYRTKCVSTLEASAQADASFSPA